MLRRRRKRHLQAALLHVARLRAAETGPAKSTWTSRTTAVPRATPPG